MRVRRRGWQGPSELRGRRPWLRRLPLGAFQNEGGELGSERAQVPVSEASAGGRGLRGCRRGCGGGGCGAWPPLSLPGVAVSEKTGSKSMGPPW